MSRLYLFAILALCSCAPAYISNTRNVPLFGERQEFAGAVAISSGIDLQTAYSLSDNIALMANGSIVSKKYSEPATFSRDHRFGEMGIGYFGRSRTSRYEIFTGYGLGQGNSYESFYFFGQQEVVAKGKYQRIFVQPSIGTNGSKFNMALTSRISLVNFTEFSTSASSATLPSVKPTEKFHVFLEPSLTTRFHLIGNLHGFFQLSLNMPVPEDVYFDYVPLQAAFGIQVHTGELRTRVY